MGDVVKKGNQVVIQYVGRLADGKVFDSTEGREPFSFVAGSSKVITGISKAVVGMTPGEKREVEVEPLQAYGEFKQDLVIKVARSKVPGDVKIGSAIADHEKKKMWWIQELTPEHVVLDGNHPLAGEKLFYELELVSVS